jgi:phosphatidylinositol alpha-mannosyltransferase
MIDNLSTVSASSRRRPSRTHLGALLAILVLGAMVALAATKINITEASSALSHASIAWVIVSALSVAAAFFARSESWFSALRTALPDCAIERPAVARSLMIGVAASTVAPARAGEAVRTLLMSRRIGGGRCTTVIGTVVAQTICNVVALALLAVIVVTSSSTRGLHLATVGIAVATPILIVLALAALTRLLRTIWPSTHPHRAGPIARAGCWLQRQMSGAGRGLKMFAKPSTIAHAGGFQLLAWALQCFACFAAMQALHLHTSPAAAAAILLAINLAAVVPVTPGNVGLFQAACIAVLTPLGVNAGDALAYGLLLQGIEIVVALGLAIPAVLHEGLSLRDLGRAAAGGRSVAIATN